MRKIFACLMIGIFAAAFSGCIQTSVTDESSIGSTVTGEASQISQEESAPPENNKLETVTEGTENYRGFVVDNILHSDHDGDIHYNVYIPESYDGKTPLRLWKWQRCLAVQEYIKGNETRNA